MNILAVDTSAKVSSVAIASDSRVISEFSIDTKLTHSQTLMPMIQAALSMAGLQISDIDGFAASTGPGSFTGLRIGIGAIKGMAFASDKPCAGVSTLYALALNMQGVDGIICAAMDARCNQVYTALFDASPDKITRITEDMALSLDELMEKLDVDNKSVFFVGDGSILCYNKYIERSKNGYLADCSKRYQHASNVAIAAGELFAASKAVSAAELMPAYLRLPQAERERLSEKSKN